MPLAGIGPITSAGEAAAATIGAWILLGSFVLGALALLLGTSRERLEGRVLTDGYVGGLAGVCAIVVDLAFR